MTKTRKLAELPGAWSHAEIEDLLGHAGRLLETLDKGIRKIGAAAYPPKSNAAVFFLADVSSPLLELRVRLRPDCFHLRFAANEPRKIYEGLELLDSVVDELTRLGFARSDLSTVPDVPANVFVWLETGIAWLREYIGDNAKGDAREQHIDKSLAATIERLNRLREQGEPYTSQPKLSKSLDVAVGQINAAFAADERLRKWMDTASAAKTRRSRKSAERLTKEVADDTRQTRESDPTEFLPDEDVDKILAKLVKDAPEAQRGLLRKTFEGGTSEERRKWASVYSEAPDISDKSHAKI